MANAAIAALHQSTFNGIQIRCKVSDCYSYFHKIVVNIETNVSNTEKNLHVNYITE